MKKALYYLASFLVLFTFLGHTAGHFMKVPPEQSERVQVYESMKRPLIIMPIGQARSFAEVLSGANLSLSLYLLVAGLSFFLFARSSSIPKAFVYLNSLGIGGVAVLSVFYFFPLPAACLAIAAIAGIWAASIRA